jgi:hypothetical protein
MLSRRNYIVSKPQENWRCHDPSISRSTIGEKKRCLVRFKLCFIEIVLSSVRQGLFEQCHAYTDGD